MRNPAALIARNSANHRQVLADGVLVFPRELRYQPLVFVFLFEQRFAPWFLQDPARHIVFNSERSQEQFTAGSYLLVRFYEQPHPRDGISARGVRPVCPIAAGPCLKQVHRRSPADLSIIMTAPRRI